MVYTRAEFMASTANAARDCEVRMMGVGKVDDVDGLHLG